MDKSRVIFYPENKQIDVPRGSNLLAAAVSAGVYINSSCGGDGVCGRCKVIVKEGQVRAEASGRISAEERKQGYCLSCRATVLSDLVIEVPAESRLDLEKISEEDAKFLRLKGLYNDIQEVDKSPAIKRKEVFVHSPLATKLYLEMPLPTLTDTTSDLERLYRAIRAVKEVPIMQTGLANVKRLGHILRESDWKITVTLGKRNETTEIVIVEPGDTSHQNFGIAFDIGTTTIAGQLVNLNTKNILGTKAAYNKQAAFGSDVISRIIYASEKDGLERLHHVVVDTMNAIIQELVKEHSIDLNNVNGVMCAGNTTMVHLLLKVDPTYIRREPYVSTANFVPAIRAAETGLKVNLRGLLACVPGVSTYVGGDIVAGVLATGLYKEDSVTMLIDIGTNGEIVVGNKEWMMACSASAGPSFEGSGITCGMRAASGAIQRVKITRGAEIDVAFETIQGAKPRGICGSGLIDLLGELFKAKIMDRSGKLDITIKSRRLRVNEIGEAEFVLAFKEDTDTAKDIVITESDIENLKRSKGSIYAASSIMLRHLGMSFDEVHKIFIAGGFGTSLDIDKAVFIGLLPDISRKKFQFVGNSSLAGSREILLSYDAMVKAEEIAKKITYLELSVDPKYMDEYMSSLFFPHTDVAKFPSVK